MSARADVDTIAARIVELQNDLGYKLQHQLYAIETIAGCLAEQMGAENDPARKALLWLCEEATRMAGELRGELERLCAEEPQPAA